MKKLFSKLKNSEPGEPQVWLMGAGLAVALLMIVVLLGVISINGLSAFWPKRVVTITTPDSQIAGHIIVKQKKYSDHLQNEWQLFTGNRDLKSEPFVFVNEKNIQKVIQPENISVLERREYGPAIGFLKEIQFENKTIDFKNSDFDTTLQSSIDLATQKIREVKHIEDIEIRKIINKQDSIRLDLKFMDLKNSKYSALKLQLENLEQEYKTLALKSQNIRDQLSNPKLKYQLITGEDNIIPVSKVVSYLYPNRLNTFERVGIFISNFKNFLTQEPREANTEGGVFPALFGTFVMTLLMCLIVTPLGVIVAVYLSEYAGNGYWSRFIRIIVNNLAGVPSIVYGVFGLGFFVYIMGGTIDHLFFSKKLPTPTLGTGGLIWASFTMALLTLPVVIVASEESLSSIGHGLRQAGLSLGASKWQVIYRILIPSSLPGILTGMILAMARGAGEVAPLMLVGVVKLAPSLPIDSVFPYVHLDQKFMHLGFHIYDLGFQSPDSEAARPMVFATTLLLLALVLLLNLGAMLLRERLRRKYAS